MFTRWSTAIVTHPDQHHQPVSAARVDLLLDGKWSLADAVHGLRSTACDPRATGVGGVCRRIRPPTSSLYSVLADLIRTQILQLAPGPQLQGDKTHTQHPNFSLPAEWEDKKITTSVVDCDLTAHCYTTALHVSRQIR